jgi:5-methylcytosine-specific restriction endonuclease McrA
VRRDRGSRLFEAIFVRDRGSCVYCGMPVLRPGPGLHRASDRATLDHLIPKPQGGALTESNVVLACRACNNERGTLDAEAFRARKRGSPA